MKLYQALKEKNKIIGRINELTQLIQSKNSTLSTNPSKFNLDEILVELETQKSDLISLKTRIYKTNYDIQHKIFTIAELKTEIKFWTSLPAREGTEYNQYSKESYTYVAHFNEVHIRAKKEELQKQIEKIQEELDYYNHTTDLVA